MVQGVNLIDFKRTIEVGERKPTKGEQSAWSKWEIPKKRFDELTEPPKEGGKMLSLSLGQRLGLIVLLIFILIAFFQLVGWYINSKR